MKIKSELTGITYDADILNNSYDDYLKIKTALEEEFSKRFSLLVFNNKTFTHNILIIEREWCFEDNKFLFLTTISIENEDKEVLKTKQIKEDIETIDVIHSLESIMNITDKRYNKLLEIDKNSNIIKEIEDMLEKDEILYRHFSSSDINYSNDSILIINDKIVGYIENTLFHLINYNKMSAKIRVDKIDSSNDLLIGGIEKDISDQDFIKENDVIIYSQNIFYKVEYIADTFYHNYMNECFITNIYDYNELDKDILNTIIKNIKNNKNTKDELLSYVEKKLNINSKDENVNKSTKMALFDLL